MATETLETQVVGQDGDPCPTCAAPLARDQRYCLNCGTRTTAPRVAFVELLGTTAPPATAVGASAPAYRPAERPVTTATAGMGLIGVVLLVGLGFLIGKAAGGEEQVVQPAKAPIVNVGTGVGEAAAASGESGSARSKKKSRKGSEDDAVSLKGAEKVDRGQLQALDNLSAGEYQKRSKKLPDKLAIPGRPPPRDNKAAGGGGDAQVIE